MASLANQQVQAIRGLIVGYPKAGKTGALVPLVNAGFKLRIIDFDGNLDPIIHFANPAMLGNVDAIYFEDRMRIGGNFQEPVGIPTAFADALKSLDKWAYKLPDGTEVDLGASKDWGPDTIVVLDTITEMGNAAFMRAQKLMNKTPLNTTQRVWSLAMSEQENFIKRLASKNNRFHVLALAHLKMIGPKDIEKDDDAYTQDLKKRAAQLVETRLFPSALGQALPPVIGGNFPLLLKVEPKYRAGKVSRVIRTVPQPELDLGVPHPDIPDELPLETGLLTIFEKLSPGSVALVKGQSVS